MHIRNHILFLSVITGIWGSAAALADELKSPDDITVKTHPKNNCETEYGQSFPIVKCVYLLHQGCSADPSTWMFEGSEPGVYLTGTGDGALVMVPMILCLAPYIQAGELSSYFSTEDGGATFWLVNRSYCPAATVEGV